MKQLVFIHKSYFKVDTAKMSRERLDFLCLKKLTKLQCDYMATFIIHQGLNAYVQLQVLTSVAKAVHTQCPEKKRPRYLRL